MRKDVVEQKEFCFSARYGTAYTYQIMQLSEGAGEGCFTVLIRTRYYKYVLLLFFETFSLIIGMTDAAKIPVSARNIAKFVKFVPNAQSPVAVVNMMIEKIITCFLPYLFAKEPNKSEIYISSSIYFFITFLFGTLPYTFTFSSMTKAGVDIIP